MSTNGNYALANAMVILANHTGLTSIEQIRDYLADRGYDYTPAQVLNVYTGRQRPIRRIIEDIVTAMGGEMLLYLNLWKSTPTTRQLPIMPKFRNLSRYPPKPTGQTREYPWYITELVAHQNEIIKRLDELTRLVEQLQKTRRKP